MTIIGHRILNYKKPYMLLRTWIEKEFIDLLNVKGGNNQFSFPTCLVSVETIGCFDKLAVLSLSYRNRELSICLAYKEKYLVNIAVRIKFWNKYWHRSIMYMLWESNRYIVIKQISVYIYNFEKDNGILLT